MINWLTLLDFHILARNHLNLNLFEMKNLIQILNAYCDLFFHIFIIFVIKDVTEMFLFLRYSQIIFSLSLIISCFS